MIFFSAYKDRLIGKCDACGKTVEGYKGETDRCELTCGIFKDEGWMQKKEHGKWKHFCPECKAYYYQAKRQSYFGRADT